MRRINIFVLLILLFVIIFACRKQTPIPKPRGYFRLTLPARATFDTLKMDICAFAFQYPSYIHVEQDTLFFDEKPEEPCWLNLKYPELKGVLHMSYKRLAKHDIEKLTEEYHRMKFEHVVKAEFIDDASISSKEKNVFGLISDLGGEVATPLQFYLTDSSRHFVRGALYFSAEVNTDSLAPAVQFAKEDILAIIDSWAWK